LNREERKKWYYEQTHKIVNGIIHKQCTKCKEWLPDTNEYFYMRNKKKPERGLNAECKKCTIDNSQKWIENNPEQYKITTKNKNDNISEITRIIRRKLANKQREEGYQKEYQRNNPDKVIEYNKNRQHKNHKINKTEWENCKKYFDYQCAYCGLPLSKHFYTRNGITKLGDFHKEHVDHEGLSDLSNCIPSCGSCNDQKWKFTLDEWYDENNERFTQERYDKIIKWITEDYKQYIEEYIPKRKYNKKIKTLIK
jgi:hypothetical protein